MHCNFRLFIGGALLSALMVSCATESRVVSVSRTRMLVDHRYDASPDTAAVAFLAPYKATVDSLMSPVVGIAAHDMAAARPESDLSNLLADILIWGAGKYGERPDFAVYNMGGIRAALTKGVVTIGNVLDVAPFENKLCVLTLKGDKVMELFAQMAKVGGEAVSHGVRLVITADGALKSAEVNGAAVDTTRLYRVATLDYLAQGNDKLEAFKHKTNVMAPEGEHNNVRHIIENYFKEKQQRGLEVESKTEGRIVVE